MHIEQATTEEEIRSRRNNLAPAFHTDHRKGTGYLYGRKISIFQRFERTD